MELGKTLPLGIYAYDPDSMINPLGFVLDINGEEMDTVITARILIFLPLDTDGARRL